MSNNCFKYAPKWMVSSLIFQKFSGEGLTEPPPQTPPPAFSRASPSVRASPSILGRFAPSTRASPSILGRFAPSIRASPLTFDWRPWFGPPQSKFLDPPLDLTRLRRSKSTQVDFPESTPRSVRDQFIDIINWTSLDGSNILFYSTGGAT